MSSVPLRESLAHLLIGLMLTSFSPSFYKSFSRLASVTLVMVKQGKASFTFLARRASALACCLKFFRTVSNINYAGGCLI